MVRTCGECVHYRWAYGCINSAVLAVREERQDDEEACEHFKCAPSETIAQLDAEIARLRALNAELVDAGIATLSELADGREARETIARMAEEIARLNAQIKELKNRPMECDPY